MMLLELVQPVADAAAAAHSHVAAVAAPFQGWTPPDAPVEAPPGSGGIVKFMSYAKWTLLIVSVLALMWAGGTFMYAKRQGDGHEMGPTLVKWVIGVTIGGGAGAIVSAFTLAMDIV